MILSCSKLLFAQPDIRFNVLMGIKLFCDGNPALKNQSTPASGDCSWLLHCGTSQEAIYRNLQETARQSRYAYALISGYLDRLIIQQTVEDDHGVRIVFSCRDLQAEAASITVMKTVSSFVNVHLWQLGRSIWLPYPVLCHQRSWSSGSMKVPRVNGFNDISMTWFADAMAVIGSDDTIFLDPGWNKSLLVD